MAERRQTATRVGRGTPYNPLGADVLERVYGPRAEERTQAAEGERNFTAQPRRRRLRIVRED